MRPALLLAILLLTPACRTSRAHVPTVDRTDAIKLVIDDLTTLKTSPTDAHWQRAYTHFDKYIEPHLTAEQRLPLEHEFAKLRTSPPDQRNLKIEALINELQPES